jgi:hypothetical protein
MLAQILPELDLKKHRCNAFFQLQPQDVHYTVSDVVLEVPIASKVEPPVRSARYYIGKLSLLHRQVV